MTYICDDKINTNILRGEGKLVIGVVVFERRNDGRAIKAYVLVNPQLRVENDGVLVLGVVGDRARILQDCNPRDGGRAVEG